MSWHFSRALVAAYSGGFSRGSPPFAPSNLIPTALGDSSSAKMKDTCHHSPFGTMFVPSTDGPGAALLMWFRGASHAKTSVVPETAMASRGRDRAFGEKCGESLAKYDPASHSLKTRQCLLFEDSTESCVILPRWGMMRIGGCWERTTPARHTSANAFGLWPTPTSCMSKGTSMAALTRKSGKSRENDRLDHAVAAEAIRSFATPQARDFRTGQQERFTNPERSKNLNDQIGGSLNPTWVEWLMGWPLGWTDLNALETAKFQQWLDSHGKR